MERKRFLTNTRNRGNLLVEACVAMSLMLIASFYVFSSTISAARTTSFAVMSQLLDNWLENQAAAVRVASIQPGGALTMPSFSTLTFASTASSTTTVTIAPGSPYTARVKTIRRSSPAIEEHEAWEYVIEGTIPRRLPNGTTTTFVKTRSVIRVVSQ